MTVTVYNYNKLLGKMKESGISQEELARGIGRNTATLSGKLNNKSCFTQRDIAAICDVLKIAPHDIPEYFFAH